MALAEAIMVCLAEKPRTGYELAKFFQTSIGFFWEADHPQIYRELRRLEKAGFIRTERVVQQSRPNKRVNELTEAGRDHLRAWSAEPAPPPSIRDDLAVRLYSLEAADMRGFLAEVRTRLRQHEERLALYHVLQKDFFPDVKHDDLTQQGRLLGLTLGIAYEQTWRDWCRHALGILARWDEPPDC